VVDDFIDQEIITEATGTLDIGMLAAA